MSRKVAVLFPGIGYHVDRPLLYYSKKLVITKGYECFCLEYTGIPTGIFGNHEKIVNAIEIAYEQVKEQIDKLHLCESDEVLFISKSIGSALACRSINELRLPIKHVLYTPINETMDYEWGDCIVFHGTRDPWCKNERFQDKCQYETHTTYHIVEEANHSLEADDVIKNIDIMKEILLKVEVFIQKLFRIYFVGN